MKKGFTLIELLIVLALSSIVLASVFRSFLSMQKVYDTQDQIAEMNQSARVAMERIAKDIRNIANINAGPLVDTDGVSIRGIRIVPGKDIDNNTSTGIDLLKIVVYTPDSPKRITGSTTNSVSSTTIPVDSTTNFEANDYAVITDRTSTEVFQITQKSSSPFPQFTTSQLLSKIYPANSEVYKVNYLDYGIRLPSSSNDYNDNCNCRVLKRKNNKGGGAVTLAENVGHLNSEDKGLNFKYIDTNGNEILSPPTNTVKITLVARTSKQDANYGYRTRTLTSNVKIRNIQ